MFRRSVTALVCALAIVTVVAACGGSAPAESATQPAGGGAGAGSPDLPLLSVVIFGTAYDPSTLAVTGRTTSVKTGTPLVAVGRILQPRTPSEVTVQVTSPTASRVEPLTAQASLGDPSDVHAVDLTPLNLPPGTWIVNFVSPNNRVIASGNLSITP